MKKMMLVLHRLEKHWLGEVKKLKKMIAVRMLMATKETPFEQLDSPSDMEPSSWKPYQERVQE
jgi:hypothetical protein